MERWRDHRYVSEVRSRADFTEFLEVLKLLNRKPVVAISVADGAPAPNIDVAALEKDLDDSVEFYVLPAEVTFWLTDALGDKSLSVHSGWVRVYPSTPTWLSNPFQAPRFPPMPSGPQRAVKRVVEAALDAAFAGRNISVSAAAAPGAEVTVRVKGVLSPTQALVVDKTGRQAILRTNHLVHRRLDRRGPYRRQRALGGRDCRSHSSPRVPVSARTDGALP